MIDGNLAMNSNFENMSEKDQNEGYDNYVDELVRKEAIEFAVWIGKNHYLHDQHGWYWFGTKGLIITREEIAQTAAELYQLYKESQQTK